MTSRNHSGVVGVYLGKSTIKRRGNEYEYWRWIARWVGCKYSGGLGWAINSLGDDDAFALAVISRRLETVDRNKILSYLENIYGSNEHEDIMKLKKLDA